ncbi:hypothetical protein NW752_000102 [Fusarium irregulare]|nr:hypothetical protein NW752_000102 [Fusarium irregulare]
MVSYDDNVNSSELSIEGVFNSGAQGVLGYNRSNEYTYAFSYTGPSIDPTELCITISLNQGIVPFFYFDSVSLTAGRAVPILIPTEP